MGRGFVCIPKDWIKPGTPDKALKVFGLLWRCSRERGRGRTCNPGVDYIAEELGMHARTVQRMLDFAEEDGRVDIIEPGGGSGRTNTYRLNLETPAPMPGIEAETPAPTPGKTPARVSKNHGSRVQE